MAGKKLLIKEIKVETKLSNPQSLISQEEAQVINFVSKAQKEIKRKENQLRN
ncbi:hypothetical protein [Coxiella-like endosymbiont]|uniref:hypothetical protein n=1 Tax=Coxiella-like endosymbiont TaxID=1592897 RepID=UPI00272CCA50|nr:hypothetical protein [Coxiella-like endosymbiont]